MPGRLLLAEHRGVTSIGERSSQGETFRLSNAPLSGLRRHHHRMNEAEHRFAAYLTSHGYTSTFEPDYRAEFQLSAPLTTQPDFLIARNAKRAVCEVRQFETTGIRDALARAGGYMSSGPEIALKPLRWALVEKAIQLAPLASLGVPLMIALANPLGADVFLDKHHITAAMFGNPSFRIPIDPTTGGAPESAEMHWALEDYGVFRSPIRPYAEPQHWENRHPHISAVLVVHERLHSDDWRHDIMRSHDAADSSLSAAIDAGFEAVDEINAGVAAGAEPVGAYQWADVYELDGEQAVPVPSDWFDGPGDTRYGFNDAQSYGPRSIDADA